MATTPIGGLVTQDADTSFTGNIRVNAADAFHIVDPTDATKILKFDCSGITTGTTTTFAPTTGGSEVTTDGTQSLTNKSLEDTTTTFFNHTSATKKFQFLASSITAGQTRIVTVPDSNGTIAYLAGSTLTTAILTAPTINAATLTGSISGGTFASSTLTAPTINAATLTGSISGGTFASSTLTAPTINAATLTGSISGGTFASSTLTAPTINAATLTGSISGGTFASSTLTSPTINGATLTGTISGGTLSPTGIVRTSQKTLINGFARPGSGVGFVAASVLSDNMGELATLPQAQTAATLIVPITGLHVGDTITSYYLQGNILSGGNTATLDATLRSLTIAAGGPTDASLGAMTQISVTANTAINSANSTKTITSHVVVDTESYYMLLTATTGVSCSMTIQGAVIVVTTA